MPSPSPAQARHPQVGSKGRYSMEDTKVHSSGTITDAASSSTMAAAAVRSTSRPLSDSVRGFFDGMPGSPSIKDLRKSLERLMLRDAQMFARVQASMKGISSLAKETTTLHLGSDASGATLINQYVLIKTLGKGSFGKVKLCLNTIDGCMYAVKMVNRVFVLRQLQRPLRGASLRKRSSASAATSTHALATQSHAGTARLQANAAGNPASSSLMSGDARSTGAIRYSLDETRRPCFASGSLMSSGHVPSPIGPLESVMREIAVLKRLDHPNVVRLHEIIDPPGSAYIMMVMEYMEDGPVLDTVTQSGFHSFSEDVSLKYFRQVCCGLSYLHFNNVAHGDIKPENLLLTAGGECLKIGDFGSSRIINDVHASSRVSCTPAFQPPEAVQGSCRPEHAFAGDVWSLGVVLYCFVYGQLPFRGANALCVSKSVVEGTVEYPKLDTALSDELMDLFSRIFVANPDHRITLQGVMRHPWTTRNGAAPLPDIAEHSCPITVTRGQAMSAIDHSLASLIRAKLKERVFSPGEYIFREHAEAHCVYMIMSGIVEMVATKPVPADVSRKANRMRGTIGDGAEDEHLTLDVDESLILEFKMEFPADGIQEDGKLHLSKEQAAALRQRMSDFIMGKGQEYVAQVHGPGQVIGELSLDNERVVHHLWAARAKTDVVAVKLTEENLMHALSAMYDNPATMHNGQPMSLGLAASEEGSRTRLLNVESVLSLLSDDMPVSGATAPLVSAGLAYTVDEHSDAGSTWCPPH